MFEIPPKPRSPKDQNLVVVLSGRSTVGLLFLSGCGGEVSSVTGRFDSYGETHLVDYQNSASIDPHFKALQPELASPYWITSLLMGDADDIVTTLIAQHSRVVEFTFPDTRPIYLDEDVRGWQPATSDMEQAAREIFDRLETYLDISFVEGSGVQDFNVIAISKSQQNTSQGFSHYPSLELELGMDVFIAENYSEPFFVSSENTNLDYEILLHEIFHALGLKHPFHSDASNSSVLNFNEDNSSYTAMSYNLVPSDFSGDARVLDLMALTELYGVNPSYNPGNDTYSFSNSSGVFIIDGGGRDTITYQGNQNAFVDLRSGGHSYLGAKSEYITSAKQLTISSGSSIEDAATGSGSDTIIGNSDDNSLSSGSGDDRIFGGEGIDVIIPGSGSNVIDLSEDIQASDTVEISATNNSGDWDTIYGFAQGDSGDCIHLADILSNGFDFLPLISIANVPYFDIASSIVRIVGLNLESSEDVETALKTGSLTNLGIPQQSQSILLCADTQGTGEEQRLYAASTMSGELAVNQLVVFEGNYLDIDMWTSANFAGVV